MTERLTAEELADLKQYYCLRFQLDSRVIPSRAGELFNKLLAAAEENERLWEDLGDLMLKAAEECGQLREALKFYAYASEQYDGGVSARRTLEGR